jgi:hypothetical protein
MVTQPLQKWHCRKSEQFSAPRLRPNFVKNHSATLPTPKREVPKSAQQAAATARHSRKLGGGFEGRLHSATQKNVRPKTPFVRANFPTLQPNFNPVCSTPDATPTGFPAVVSGFQNVLLIAFRAKRKAARGRFCARKKANPIPWH